MTKKYWKQLSMHVAGDRADAAGELLDALGAVALTHRPVGGDDRFDLAEPTMENWPVTEISALFEDDIDLHPVIDEISHTLRLTPDNCVVERFEDRDWEREWLEQFKPVRIAANLWICPTWHDPPNPGACNLRLDPGLAFGTGTHATTRLCLERLADSDLSGKTVLDFGCGSGILAIAGLLLGARRAIACDIDPRALDATRENARLNRVDDRLEAFDDRRMTEMIATEGFVADFVIANILSEALIALSHTLSTAVASGGNLMLSGILENQETEVVNSFPERRFEAFARDGWVLLESR